jgi:hypothetical protein
MGGDFSLNILWENTMKVRTILVPHNGLWLQIQFEDDPNIHIPRGRIVDELGVPNESAVVSRPSLPPARVIPLPQSRAQPLVTNQRTAPLPDAVRKSRKPRRQNDRRTYWMQSRDGTAKRIPVPKALREGYTRAENGRFQPDTIVKYENYYVTMDTPPGKIFHVSRDFSFAGSERGGDSGRYAFAAYGIYKGWWDIIESEKNEFNRKLSCRVQVREASQ